MGRLTTRVEHLERRGRGDICLEHELEPPTPRSRDYRDGLAPFLPDPAVRAAYDAEMDALEAGPPCPRCGRKDEQIFRVVCGEDGG